MNFVVPDDILHSSFEIRYEYLKHNIKKLTVNNFSLRNFITPTYDDREQIIDLILDTYKKKRVINKNIIMNLVGLKIDLIPAINDFEQFNDRITKLGLDFIFNDDLTKILKIENIKPDYKSYISFESKREIIEDILNSKTNIETCEKIINNLCWINHNINPNYILELLEKIKINDRLKNININYIFKNKDKNKDKSKNYDIYFEIYKFYGIDFNEKIIMNLNKQIKIPDMYLKLYNCEEEKVIDLSLCEISKFKKRDLMNAIETTNIKEKHIVDILEDSTKIIYKKIEGLNTQIFKPPKVIFNPNIEDLKNINFLKYIKNNNLQIYDYFVVDKKLSEILNIHISCMINVDDVLQYLQ
jgi:hypothetical protein